MGLISKCTITYVLIINVYLFKNGFKIVNEKKSYVKARHICKYLVGAQEPWVLNVSGGTEALYAGSPKNPREV